MSSLGLGSPLAFSLGGNTVSNPNPASDLATKLGAIALFGDVTLTLGTNVFVGPERPVRAEVPAQAVFCLNLSGIRPEPYIGAAIDKDFYRFQVEVLVRSPAADFSTGETLARLIIEQAQRQAPSGYVALLVQQSGPEYLGSDEERLHRWRLVAELWWKG